MSVLQKFVQYTEEHMEETELWMLPYSTLMLTLVILFIMFYAFSFNNSVEYESALSNLASTNPDDPRVKQMQMEISLAKDIRDYIAKNHMEDKIQLNITPHEIKIKMASLALFDSGSADLKPDITTFLDYLYTKLKPMSNRIISEGHTDAVPIHNQRFDSNWELSSARAFSVIYFFINKGISPDRLVAHGFGEFRPASSNDTEADRAKNRRIEITIVRGAQG
ncbi:MAG: OmpA family protein [Nitrospiraceae bacterium]|nr:OmpA family protein [Nitrospiraceae bacterium]